MSSNGSQPMDALKGVGQDILKSLGQRALGEVTDRVSGLTDKFDGIASGIGLGGDDKDKDDDDGGADESGSDDDGGDEDDDDEGGGGLFGGVKNAFSNIKDKVTGGGGGGSSGGKPTKAINIIETVDVGVPLRVAFNQWTEYDDWSTMMKKVEDAGQDKEEPKVHFKVQIFLSHRQWDATITDQIPDERIVWKSQGTKGHVDGAVTFHELGPNFTRILIVLEYYPQGPFEWMGNRWRAQGRRARLEFKNFRRHVMTRTILDPDSVEGWRGTIEDSEITKTHEEALEEEEQERQDAESEDQDEDGYDDEYDEDSDEESDEDEDSEDSEDEESDEYGDDESEEDEEEPEEEESEEAEDAEEEPEEQPEEEEPTPRRRRRRERANA